MNINVFKRTYSTGWIESNASHREPWNCYGTHRWNLLMTEKGCGIITNEHGELKIERRMLVLSAPTKRRTFYVPEESWHAYWFHFDDPGELVRWEEPVKGIYCFPLDDVLLPQIRSIVQEAHQLILLQGNSHLLLVGNLLANLILRGNLQREKS